jgi:hypothetical protein
VSSSEIAGGWRSAGSRGRESWPRAKWRLGSGLREDRASDSYGLGRTLKIQHISRNSPSCLLSAACTSWIVILSILSAECASFRGEVGSTSRFSTSLRKILGCCTKERSSPEVACNYGPCLVHGHDGVKRFRSSICTIRERTSVFRCDSFTRIRTNGCRREARAARRIGRGVVRNARTITWKMNRAIVFRAYQIYASQDRSVLMAIERHLFVCIYLSWYLSLTPFGLGVLLRRIEMMEGDSWQVQLAKGIHDLGQVLEGCVIISLHRQPNVAVAHEQHSHPGRYLCQAE